MRGEPSFDLVLIADGRTAEASAIDLVAAAERALEGAPRGRLAVQLRAKDFPGRTVLALARSLRESTARAGASFFVNDRLDVASAVGADGVQLGRASVGVDDARRFARDGANRAWLVGVSTHGTEEVAHAEADGADFVFFGPVFDTPGKAPALGLAALERACSHAGLPVFALGGIDPKNAAACREAGAHGVAVIRSILTAPDPAEATHRLARALDGVTKGDSASRTS